MIPALLMTIQAVTPPSPAVGDQPPTVVVVGRRPDQTAADLAACMARRCPPADDIRLSLAKADAEFLAGSFEQARATLLAARHRNARFSKTLPVEVAGLQRANARLASINGYPETARLGEIDALDALKDGLPATDPLVLFQRLRVGDAYAAQGRFEAAIDTYNKVARQGREGRFPLVEGDALFRIATTYGAMASLEDGYLPAARKAIERIAATTDPALAPFREAGTLLTARIAALRGDTAALDKAIAALQARRTSAPKVLFAPPILGPNDIVDNTTASLTSVDPEWIDISFWVRPEGMVDDVGVMRQSRRFDKPTLALIRRALAGRRYAPLTMPPGSPGIVQVERYVIVHDTNGGLASHIDRRKGEGRVEVVELTTPASTN